MAGRRLLLIGQSLGGHTAMLAAARHPELVERLVVIEASPERDPDGPERIRTFFEAIPAAYAVALDPAQSAASVEEIAARDWWDEWRAVRCPVLVVRGERGHLDASVAARMCAENGNAAEVCIAAAGHDVHLDQPTALADAIARFVRA